MDTGKELGFVCVRCQENKCVECIDIMRFIWNQKLICKCPRLGHDGEPRNSQVEDPFDGSVHGPNIRVGAGGEVAYAASITCPKCDMTSHHPEDVKNMYCGNCNQFHAEMEL